MAEAIDIRALNEQIERQSAFVTNLMTGMDQVIVGQKHLVESLLDRKSTRLNSSHDRQSRMPSSA